MRFEMICSGKLACKFNVSLARILQNCRLIGAALDEEG